MQFKLSTVVPWERRKVSIIEKCHYDEVWERIKFSWKLRCTLAATILLWRGDRKERFTRQGDATWDDWQRRFLAHHSIATLLWHCFEWSQHWFNIATVCCTKNRCSESSRVTSPLSPKSDQHHFSLTNAEFLYYSQKTDYWSKWSTTEVDSLDHIQNRILWLHDLKSFFYTMEPKEWILPGVTWNTFKRYISYLTTLLIFKAIFEHEAWIKRSTLSVLLGR